ncbi:MAG TPA: tetratricopeptide repeat protein [Gemmatimonadaceae bacterium]|nr:tetratricopeptide repeat protein [Gemmatimonadaceae bacterium]
MSNVAKLKKRALEFEQKKQFDRALELYAQVLDQLDEPVEEADMALYNRVGDLLLRHGDVARAVDRYEQAVDLYSESGFFNNAIALCNKILRNAPGRSSVYYKLGKISAQKGFITDAKQNFLEYADRMQQSGNLEEAFRALKEFADLCPDQDDIRLMLADQLVRKDRKSEAIEQFERLYEKFQTEGRKSEARATLERMTAVDPDFVPKKIVSTPTPRSSDLIFLDVNYDSPSPRGAARGNRQTPGGQPAVRAAAPSPPEPPQVGATDGGDGPGHEGPPAAADGAPAMPIELLPIEPLPLAGTEGAHEADGMPADAPSVAVPAPDTEISLLTGFEPTELPHDTASGVNETPRVEDATTSPIADGASLVDVPLDDLPALEVSSPDLELTVDADGDFSRDLMQDADLPMLDIPLEDAMPAEDALLAPDAELPGIAMPAAETTEAPDTKRAGDESVAPVDIVRMDAPVVESAIEPKTDAMLAESAPALEVEADPSHETAPADGTAEATSEPLSTPDAPVVGDEPATPDARAITPPTGAAELPSEPAESAVDRMRRELRDDPANWLLRRQLAEALIEAGDRSGGLRELNAAMSERERASDLAAACVLAEEIIRIEPNSVRHHQKRVEFAVRSNDSARLVDAYLDLAEALFRIGELDKSRVVYARVLELAPDDRRARSAMQSLGREPTPANGRRTLAADSAPAPSRNGATRHEPVNTTSGSAPTVRAAPDRPAPESDAAGFVNLADWLREDTAPTSTRMIAEGVREPARNEQVDFNEMLAMFKQGVAANVDEMDHESHYDLGVAYKEMGLLDEAIAEFQKALRGAEHRLRTCEALGQCFVEKGQDQIAIAILMRALTDKQCTDDMLVGVLFHLGYASERLQRWADAARYYERVFAVDIQFRDVGDRLAAVQARCP